MVYDTKELNRNAVLTALMEARPTSRKRLAELSGISPATVTRAVDQLIAEGVVAETSEIISVSRGRRAVELDIVADLSYVVGIDLGASRTRLILGDLVGNPVAARETSTPVDLPHPQLARWIGEQVRELGECHLER
ncbi:MAG: ROK family transcriptional regulator [Sinomonas sp.]|nr:ROK family transcriptional regulator [Sinomonas sp.]